MSENVKREPCGQCAACPQCIDALFSAGYEAGLAERDALREALDAIVRLQAKWDAPVRSKDVEASNAAWAAVGSEAHKIATMALRAALAPEHPTNTIRTYIEAGFDPKTVVDAIEASDLGRLNHTGLVSVQLQPPGSDPNAGGDSGAAPAAAALPKPPDAGSGGAAKQIPAKTGRVREDTVEADPRTRRRERMSDADPRPDAQQEAANLAIVLGVAADDAAYIITTMRAAGIIVGPVDALRYAEERLLEDANVEAASRVYERSTWEGLDAGRGRDYERRDALDDSRAALTAAFRSARGGWT